MSSSASPAPAKPPPYGLSAIPTKPTGTGVIATATSGQAARTVGHDAGIESYTVASLLARLQRGTITLDHRTLVVIDEAGMTDDHHIAALLTWATAARAKVVLVGDDRQLSAVGPGGGLRALAERFDANIWELDENIRQPDITERRALAELRSGGIGTAIDWFARNRRIVAAPDRRELHGAVVDGWLSDLDQGRDTVMLAWRRNTVDALNHLARTAYTDRGWLTGPEVIASNGTHYRTGDRIVTLAPIDRHIPTSSTGTIRHINPDTGQFNVAFDHGPTVTLPHTYLAAEWLQHGYAVTVHRAQGATVDSAHTVEDGGGRELAYVGLSRARHRSTLYTEADNLDQAVEDLTSSWAIERRQQWITDTHTPAPTPQRQAPTIEPQARSPERQAPAPKRQAPVIEPPGLDMF